MNKKTYVFYEKKKFNCSNIHRQTIFGDKSREFVLLEKLKENSDFKFSLNYVNSIHERLF